jgi:hypothetical protein
VKKRGRPAKSKTPAAPSKHDPNSDPDPDDRNIEVLVEALSDGPMRLADLRNNFGLDPMAIGRLGKRFPNVFACFEQAGKPFCKLLVSPLEATLAIIMSPPPPPPMDSDLKSDRDRLLRLLQAPRHSGWLSDLCALPIERIRAIDARWLRFRPQTNL